MEDEFVVEEGAGLLGQRLDHARQKHGLDILADLGEHLVVGFLLGFRRGVESRNEFIVLRRHHYCMHAHRATVGVVFHGDLALGIGTEIAGELPLAVIGHFLPLASDIGKLAEDAVGEA